MSGEGIPSREDQLARSIRLKKFNLAIRGYSIDEVDAWLESAAVLAETHASGLIDPPARPSFRSSLRGYKTQEVDSFVEETINNLMTLN